MKAVSANMVGRIELMGQGIVVRMRRHGLMKGGIEDGHLRHVRTGGQGYFNADDIGGVMQWGQRTLLTYGSKHMLVNQGGVLKRFAPMHDPMANTE